MKLKNHIIACILSFIGFSTFAQYGSQKKADNLFNKLSFANATEVYKALIDKDYNAEYATRQLADSYAFLRNPDSAAVYYKKVVNQENVPVEYYYNYAQALRGIENYKEYRVWMRHFKNAGGVVNETNLQMDSNFVNSIFNAKQQYFLTKVNFNSKYSDFGAYVNNGKIYFASARDEGVSSKHLYGWNGEPFLDIYTVNNRTDSLINHKSKLKGAINSIYHDGPLSITKDGKTIYFSRNDYNKSTLGKNKEGISNLKIYKATLVDNEWTNIEELPFNNNSYSTGHPALNNDETKLYFASDMPGGVGGTDIYYVDINNNSFGDPKNAGSIINTVKNERFPFINSEGVLFFASDGHPGLGLLDIFGTVSNKNKDIVNVINLGVPVNSSKDDFSFFMNDDGLSGYFSSNRNGGVGSDDIYAYDRVTLLKVEGVVTDIINKKPIPNAVITLLDENSKQIAFMETNEVGYYEINIDKNVDYKITASQKKYEDDEKEFTSKNIETKITSITKNLQLTPVQDVVKLAELNTIYFDFNKHTIRPDGALELDKVVNLMKNTYPAMVIKIESHTDSRGPAEYNKKLSISRANTTYKYLVNKGINPNRITEHNGYGEQNLVNGCVDTTNCTEEEHQQNRRTQFIVIKME